MIAIIHNILQAIALFCLATPDIPTKHILQGGGGSSLQSLQSSSFLYCEVHFSTLYSTICNDNQHSKRKKTCHMIFIC